MPEMDGIEACENLRSDKIFNDTIIMFLTARGEDYSHMAALTPVQMTMSQSPLSPKLLFPKLKLCCAALRKRRRAKIK